MKGKAEARLAADRVIRDHGVSGPSVPVSKIARSLGLDVQRRKLDSEVSAILFTGGERPQIIVNKLHSRSRRRFAVAHSLGHHLLHGDRSVVFVTDYTIHFRTDSPPRNDPREREANAFAVDLLMPEYFLRNDLRSGPIDVSDTPHLIEMAARYGVTSEMLALRLAGLGLVWGV